jgi:hypothetical protein
MFADSWLRCAAMHADQAEIFEAFMFLWVTFNGWLGQIVGDRTKSELDSYLILAAGWDHDLTTAFQRLAGADAEFAESVQRFRQLWPVFKVRTLQAYDIQPWSGNSGERSQYRTNCFRYRLTQKDFAPSCFKNHQPDQGNPQTFSPSHVPADWPHTLSAVYKVRCNLFHGGKSFAFSGDTIFVELAFSILWKVWGRPFLQHS